MNPIASLGTVCGVQRTAGLSDAAAPVTVRRRKDPLAGQCQTRIIMDFVLWASTRCAYFPTVPQVQERFNVSRATAFRWRRTLADSLCLARVPSGVSPRPLPMASLLSTTGAVT